MGSREEFDDFEASQTVHPLHPPYQMVVRYTNHQGKHSAEEIREILLQQAPEAPAGLVDCIDVSRFDQ